MTNAISLPYSTSSGVYGTTLSSTYEWYVQWYQYPTNTSKVTSSANMKINSIAQKKSAEKINLPIGYTQLEYIQSSGTQYIDTRFIPNQDTRVVASYKMLQPSDSVWYKLWGSGNGSYNNDFSAWTKGTTQIQHYYGTQNITNTNINGCLVNIDANKNNWTYNGILNTYPEQTFACGYSMYIFNINVDNNAAYVNAKMQLFSFKIYDNGTLIRDYVPCMNANGIVGLYDLVNNEFYTNAGTGNFIGGNIVKLFLPNGYKKLDYIEANGKQWIDAGFIANQNTRVVMDCWCTGGNAGGCFPFGTRTTYGQNAFAACFTSANVFYDYGSQYQFADWANPYERMTIDANKNVATFTGSKTVTITNSTSTFTTPYNFILFSLYQSGAIATDASFVGKFYSCKIYDGDTMIRNFIPCVNDYGVAGIYDLINNKFYNSQGTEAFIASSVSVIEQTDVNVNISIYSKNAITRTGTSGYTCSTFTFKSQPTILLHNKTLGESVEVYNMALTTTVADNGSGTAVSGSIVHASTLDVTVPSSWFIEENRQWYFTISDLITIVNTGVTHTNTKTFDTFVVDALYNVWVKKSISLPDGYTQLKYIESTGTQYVDTGFIPTSSNVKIFCQWIDTDTVTGKVVFGSGDDTNKGYCVVYENKLYIGDGNISNINVANIGSVNNLELSIQDGNTWKYSINGLFYSGTYTGSINKSYSLYIFNQSPFTNRMRKMKLFVFKIYDNNILVRNFIPCLNPSNVAGLYDLVNGVFYGDASGGTFNYPATSYTPVEYIESTGTQYLDTGWYPTSNEFSSLKFVLDATFSTANSNGWAVSGIGAGGYYFHTGLNSNRQIVYGSGTADTSTGITYSEKRAVFEVDYKNKTMVVTEVDSGTVLVNQSITVNTPTASSGKFYLFAYANTSNTTGVPYTGTIYSFKGYKNNELIYDFIPVKDANGVVCMFDRITETFIYNQGTGTFVSGAETGNSVTIFNHDIFLHKAIQIYVKKNGTLFPMTNLYAKVGGAVV